MHEEALKAYHDVLDMISSLQAEAASKLQIPLHKLSVFMPQTTAAYATLARRIEETIDRAQEASESPDAVQVSARSSSPARPHPRYPRY